MFLYQLLLFLSFINWPSFHPLNLFLFLCASSNVHTDHYWLILDYSMLFDLQKPGIVCLYKLIPISNEHIQAMCMSSYLVMVHTQIWTCSTCLYFSPISICVSFIGHSIMTREFVVLFIHWHSKLCGPSNCTCRWLSKHWTDTDLKYLVFVGDSERLLLGPGAVSQFYHTRVTEVRSVRSTFVCLVCSFDCWLQGLLRRLLNRYTYILYKWECVIFWDKGFFTAVVVSCLFLKLFFFF